MKKAKENWAGEQCSEIEEKLVVSWCFEPSQPQRITSGLDGRKSEEEQQ